MLQEDDGSLPEDWRSGGLKPSSFTTCPKPGWVEADGH